MEGDNEQSNLRGRSRHLAEGVVTDLKEVSVSSMTSQKADMENGTHFIRVLIKRSKGWKFFISVDFIDSQKHVIIWNVGKNEFCIIWDL